MTQKLYETDAYVQEFAAAVLSCTPAKGGYAVVLDRTAFFPEGGGQPCDLGTLGTAKVTDVHTDGATITHTTDAPLEPGTAVTGRIDWPRRLDAMQQHTGEHILSGTLHRLFGAENVGFHIGTPYVRMDTSIPLSAAQLARAEAEANAAVRADTPVHCYIPDAATLAATEYRSKKELDGPVRLVEAGGDCCACCGTHLARTGEVGLIKIISAQHYKTGMRLAVACGQRAYVEHSVAFVCRERAWLTEQLSEIGITVFASNANFLMIKDGRPLAKELLKKGILIRDCSNYRGLSGGYYRIAVRRREENERLLAALAQVTGSSVVENGKDDKKPAAVPDGIEYVMPQEIEKRSFSIIEEELQLRGITLPVEEAMVTKRVIHTSADFSYAQTMTYSAGAVETAKRLITEGADIVTDTNMALSGINKRVLARYGGSVHCFMADEDVAREAKERGVTRATVSMERAAKIEKPVIFAIGNAPTALIQLYGMIEEGYRPAFIIGVPVGFVNVEAAKELILQTKIPHIVNRGRKGGSNVAAAICNAILYELGR